VANLYSSVLISLLCGGLTQIRKLLTQHFLWLPITRISRIRYLLLKAINLYSIVFIRVIRVIRGKPVFICVNPCNLWLNVFCLIFGHKPSPAYLRPRSTRISRIRYLLLKAINLYSIVFIRVIRVIRGKPVFICVNLSPLRGIKTD
jgi:hypothetical protein